jgi:hypothetical protein
MGSAAPAVAGSAAEAAMGSVALAVAESAAEGSVALGVVALETGG